MTANAFGAVDKVAKAGDTMTGPLILPGNPGTALGAIPQQYADAGFAAVVTYSGTWPPRPATPGTVLWIGPGAPPTGSGGAAGSDVWLNTTPGSGYLTSLTAADTSVVVGGTATAPTVRANAGPLPADFGWLAWTADPGSANSAAAPVAGTLTLMAFFLRKTATISGVAVRVAIVTSFSLTSGQNFAGIYNSAGTLLGSTADQSAAWASVGVKTMSLAAPYANAPPGMYYAAVLMNGTGTTWNLRASSPETGLANAGLAAASLRYATNGTALTSLPASVTPGSAVQANAQPVCAVIY